MFGCFWDIQQNTVFLENLHDQNHDTYYAHKNIQKSRRRISAKRYHFVIILLSSSNFGFNAWKNRLPIIVIFLNGQKIRRKIRRNVIILLSLLLITILRRNPHVGAFF